MVCEGEEVIAFLPVVGGCHGNTVSAIGIVAVGMEVALQRPQCIQILLHGVHSDAVFLPQVVGEADGVLLLPLEIIGEAQAAVFHSVGVAVGERSVVVQLILSQPQDEQLVLLVGAEDAADVPGSDGNLAAFANLSCIRASFLEFKRRIESDVRAIDALGKCIQDQIREMPIAHSLLILIASIRTLPEVLARKKIITGDQIKAVRREISSLIRNWFGGLTCYVVEFINHWKKDLKDLIPATAL